MLLLSEKNVRSMIRDLRMKAKLPPQEQQMFAAAMNLLEDYLVKQTLLLEAMQNIETLLSVADAQVTREASVPGAEG